MTNSVAKRGYTTGVATAPVIVVPYWLLARYVLRQQGVNGSNKRVNATALAAIPLTLGVHLISAALLREGSLGPALQPEDAER